MADAGTIYGRDQEELLYGLPSDAYIEEAHQRRWLVRDDTNYAARGLYPGRQAGLQTARCYPEAFMPTPIPHEAPADTNDQVREERLITARIYHGMRDG
jgi:hypothetical protein